MLKIRVIKGDITKLEVDAIVNAANSTLMGGGGVDGAIHRAGGSAILEECKKIRNTDGGCPTGEAVITTGGKLPAKFVIHTVGPIWHGGNLGEEKLLSNAYQNSLELAEQHKLKSIAFPAISTGVYKFPKDRAAAIAVREVHQFLEDNSYLEKVIFCCFDDENYELYKKLLGATG